ncbi:MAG: hypothetical protein HDS69_09355 [Bacteroidales bacterium]|nr:hypothetical protein [Bacteroidales bacterium]
MKKLSISSSARPARFSFIIGSLMCALMSLSSCEKHDDIVYFKSKCEADLNGQYLIDQTPFNWGLGPRTPYVIASEHEAEFTSDLSVDRHTMPLYYVTIQVYADEPWNFLYSTETIELVNTDDAQSISDYKNYCREHRINFATIFLTSTLETEVVKEGSFKITSYNKEKQICSGTFTLQFSEGTLTGNFSL